MILTYVGHAKKYSEKWRLSEEAQRIMQLVGEIADGDTYHGPVEVKIELVAAYLARGVAESP